MLKQVADRLKEQEIPLSWDEKVTEKLAKEGYDPKFGARPLRRLIQRTVEDTMSEELLKGNIRLGQEIRLTVKDGVIVPVSTESEQKPAKKTVKKTAKKTAAAAEKEADPIG
jgi:ATP-dependent Clp protease ATP-binding subunit ClpC